MRTYFYVFAETAVPCFTLVLRYTIFLFTQTISVAIDFALFTIRFYSQFSYVKDANEKLQRLPSIA